MMICPTCAAVYADGTVCVRDAAKLLSSSGDPLLGLELGRYRLISVIGRGGMGTVYRAVHIQIRSQVAIKVLTKTAARDKDIVDRFFAEARAVNLIRNDNIVSVMDMASLPDGRPYLVMELLEGASLKQRQRQGNLTLPQRIQVMLDVLVALTAAHDKGILHRDVKPENIFVCSNGRTKLLDFGIAKVQHAKSLMVYTETGIVMGTPQYMAPEQARGALLDARADIYAVGCVLYELTTGHLPFEHDGLFEVLRQHIEDAPIPPRQRRPELSSALERVILTAMAKTQAARFATAMAMHTALAALPEMHATMATPHAAGTSLGAASGRAGSSPSNTNLGHGAVVTQGLTIAEAPQAKAPVAPLLASPAVSPAALFTDSVSHRPQVPTGAVPLAPEALASGPSRNDAPALNSAMVPTSVSPTWLQRRKLVIVAVVAVLVGIVVVAALKSNAGDPRTNGAPANLGPFPGNATPGVAPPWPRSAQEYAALLESPDPAIVKWAKQHSPTMSYDGAAPSFSRDDATLDADAFIAYALRRATEISPDALPLQIAIVEVSAMGKMRNRPPASLSISFVAASRAVRPPELAAAAPWDGYCIFSIAFVAQLGKTSIMQIASCGAAGGPAPTCKIAEVLTQARAQGLAADATVMLVYGPIPEPNWQVVINSKASFSIPDKCGAAAAAVAPVAAPQATPLTPTVPVAPDSPNPESYDEPSRAEPARSKPARPHTKAADIRNPF